MSWDWEPNSFLKGFEQLSSTLSAFVYRSNASPSTDSRNLSGCDEQDPLPFSNAVAFGIVFLLVIMSGLFSGLTLGLLGLDITGLDIIAHSEDKVAAANARKIIPVRKNGNRLLCTLLLGNVAVNSMLAILMANLTSGMTGFLVSTAVIVVFGEILPQASCSRYALPIGARTANVVKFLMFLLLPLAYPLAYALDWILGDEMGTIHSKQELRRLLQIHVREGALKKVEGDVVAGALKFRNKPLSKVMTQKQDCFMLNQNEVLDYATILEISNSGFSRIPVYNKTDSDIVGVLVTKDLIFVDPEDAMPLRQFLKVFGRHVERFFADDTCGDALHRFKLGRAHLGLVVGHDAIAGEQNADSPEGPMRHQGVSSALLNKHGQQNLQYELQGIVTLEDVIEEILQDEIVDETDVYIDMHHKEEREYVESEEAVLPPEQYRSSEEGGPGDSRILDRDSLALDENNSRDDILLGEEGAGGGLKPGKSLLEAGPRELQQRRVISNESSNSMEQYPSKDDVEELLQARAQLRKSESRPILEATASVLLSPVASVVGALNQLPGAGYSGSARESPRQGAAAAPEDLVRAGSSSTSNGTPGAMLYERGAAADGIVVGSGPAASSSLRTAGDNYAGVSRERSEDSFSIGKTSAVGTTSTPGFGAAAHAPGGSAEMSADASVVESSESRAGGARLQPVGGMMKHGVRRGKRRKQDITKLRFFNPQIRGDALLPQEVDVLVSHLLENYAGPRLLAHSPGTTQGVGSGGGHPHSASTPNSPNPPAVHFSEQDDEGVAPYASPWLSQRWRNDDERNEGRSRWISRHALNWLLIERGNVETLYRHAPVRCPRPDAEDWVYKRGEPADFMTIILTGVVMIVVGRDGFQQECGAFSVLGIDTLAGPGFQPDFSAALWSDVVTLVRISRAVYAEAQELDQKGAIPLVEPAVNARIKRATKQAEVASGSLEPATSSSARDRVHSRDHPRVARQVTKDNYDHAFSPKSAFDNDGDDDLSPDKRRELQLSRGENKPSSASHRDTSSKEKVGHNSSFLGSLFSAFEPRKRSKLASAAAEVPAQPSRML
ncbi:unnamed protein product [Amoebophrya sp. A120]|nr:unnamed protein product [Amoebophrya sp. A120]|eukprot:GSA120T00017410001.1